ncbi:metallopeptidase TldD-related protein [Fodinicola feengrottensis]|uniref:metallopeptidase TldD-related protein n=1 Tax=Fodinicola feengrottensis TaxID=435914 RepID=UPI0024421E60|nr:metallopeptidase TldD-related protein [Fodinicola feengrottensis]
MTSAADQELGERVLAEVRRTAPGAEADVLVTTSTLALTRFANSAIHQNVTDTGTSLSLRVNVNGRTAAASLTVAPDQAAADAVRSLAERAVAACEVLPVDPGWPGLTTSGKLAHSGNYDEETAHAAPAVRADMVRAFIDGASGLSAAGVCQTSSVARTYANTAGHQVSGLASESTVDGIARAARDGGGFADGVAKLTAVRLTDIDPAALGATAAAKATASLSPVDLAPGRYEVVIEPSAAAQVLFYLGMYAFNGRAVNEGRSFVRPGQPQFDPSLTLLDDPESEDAVGMPFDADGTVKRRLTLIDAGVTATAVHSRRTAAEAGAESTGHAHPRRRPVRRAAAASASPRRSRRDRRRPGLRGDGRAAGQRLLVCPRAGPTHPGHPGLTRNGLWRIQDGRVTEPVGNLRFTQSYADAFGPGNLLAIAPTRSASAPPATPSTPPTGSRCRHCDSPHGISPAAPRADFPFVRAKADVGCCLDLRWTCSTVSTAVGVVLVSGDPR